MGLTPVLPLQSQDKLFRKVALERLSSPEELDQLMQITSPRAWLLLAALGCLLGAALIWAIFGTITVTVSGRGALVTDSATATQGALKAILYVSPVNAAQIRSGLDVRLTLSTISSDQVGYLLGTVTAVGESPATSSDMQKVMGNATIVESLTQSGAPIQVDVALKSANTVSGYQWSLPNGPNASLQSQTFCTADIIVSTSHPIQSVLPGLGG